MAQLISLHMQLPTLDGAAELYSLPPTGVKSPRELTKVLLETRHYEATDPRDTFYAVLGMCNVLAFSQETAHRRQDSKGAVLVDYKNRWSKCTKTQHCAY